MTVQREGGIASSVVGSFDPALISDPAIVSIEGSSSRRLYCGATLQKPKPWKTEFTSLPVIPMQYGRYTAIPFRSIAGRAEQFITALFTKQFPCSMTFTTKQEKEELLSMINTLFHLATNDFYAKTEGHKPVYLPLFANALSSYGLLPKKLIPKDASLEISQIKRVIEYYLGKYPIPGAELNENTIPIHFEWLVFENSTDLSRLIEAKRDLLTDPSKPARIIFTGFIDGTHGFSVAINSHAENISIFVLDSMESNTVSTQIRDLCTPVFKQFNFHYFNAQMQTDNLTCVAYALNFGKMAAFNNSFLQELTHASKLDLVHSSPNKRVFAMEVCSPILFPFVQPPNLSLTILEKTQEHHPSIAKIQNNANGYTRQVVINHTEQEFNVYMRSKFTKYFYISLIHPIKKMAEREDSILINSPMKPLDRIPVDIQENDTQELQFELDL